MQTLSPSEEARLLEGIKTAVDLVDNQGLSPDAALLKVARDQRFTRGELRSAVSAFNNGRQVAQWQANDNALDKLAEFPLADYEKIHDQIWGKTVEKAAVDPEFKQGPIWLKDSRAETLLQMPLAPLEKAAAAEEVHPLVAEHQSNLAAQRAWNGHQRAKRAYDEAHRQYSQAHDDLRIRLRLLENYFQKSAMDRLPFAVVDDTVTTYYGAHGRALMNVLAASFPQEKRAADTRLCYDRPVQRHGPPFTYAEAAIKAASDIWEAKRAMDAANAALEKAAEDLRPFVQTPCPASSQDETASLCLIKDAGIFPGLKDMYSKALGQVAPPPPSPESQWTELDDPDHENELRAIRARTILTDMMTDPSNPISGYDPAQVLQAYNEIAQVLPRGSDRAALVQPLLAKRLAGAMEPFEAGQMLDMEKGLVGAQGRAEHPNPRYLAGPPAPRPVAPVGKTAADLEKTSVDETARQLACRALAVRREKRAWANWSPEAKGALVLGGVGAGLGGLSQLGGVDPAHKKHRLSRVLSGILAGGALGAGAGMLGIGNSLFSPPENKPTLGRDSVSITPNRGNPRAEKLRESTFTRKQVGPTLDNAIKSLFVAPTPPAMLSDAVRERLHSTYGRLTTTPEERQEMLARAKAALAAKAPAATASAATAPRRWGIFSAGMRPKTESPQAVPGLVF